MKRQWILFFIVCILFAWTLHAAEPASVNWSCVADQEVSATAGHVIGQPSNGTMLVRDYTGTLTTGDGPLGKYQRWWLNANWPDDTTASPDRYIEFIVEPEVGFTFHGTAISLYLNAGGTGNMKASLYYSTEADFSDPITLIENKSVSRDSAKLDEFAINAAVDEGGKLYFRIYPWLPGGSTNTGKYVFVQDVTISGTASVVTLPASALWELTDPGAGGTGLTVATAGQVEAQDELLNNTEINQYTGPAGSQRVRIAGNAWPALQTTQIDTVFIQFAVAPKPGFTLHVTSVSLGIAAASIDYMKANIYYSTDPEFANPTMVEYSTGIEGNYLGRDSLTAVSATDEVTVNSGETFYLRIYPWVDNDPSVRTGKYVCIKNVLIGGGIEGNPTAASVVWPFEADDSPVTTGPLIAENQMYSDAMKFYGTTQLPTTDTGETVTVGAIQTVSKVWNAEAGPTDSLYFQYAVAPKFGGTFFVDSVSIYIGGWFTQNLRAVFYYSKDPTFTEKTLLIADTALVGSQVAPLGASLSETVATGETFYLRVYPYNTQAEGWAKLVVVKNATIFGQTIGVTADPPEVVTTDVTYISTTFAYSGGTIPSDGGSAVIARGVVWNTDGSPTTADSKTEDGQGSGSFSSKLIDLQNGATYHVRAYATNNAGTSYGEEKVFSTLEALRPPTVTTASTDNILAISAQSGGEVTDWGGDSVIVRGV
ncbi:hypothetical protein JW960_27360, partial [candidate division KSB1 bacterium]|nr:hypothetical protein [candidate division KSB1 bacterium]